MTGIHAKDRTALLVGPFVANIHVSTFWLNMWEFERAGLTTADTDFVHVLENRLDFRSSQRTGVLQH